MNQIYRSLADSEILENYLTKTCKGNMWCIDL